MAERNWFTNKHHHFCVVKVHIWGSRNLKIFASVKWCDLIWGSPEWSATWPRWTHSGVVLGGTWGYTGVHKGTQRYTGYTGVHRVHKGTQGTQGTQGLLWVHKCNMHTHFAEIYKSSTRSIMSLVIFSACTVMYSILYNLRMHCRIASGWWLQNGVRLSD